jgi:hypothetical protein
MVTSDMKSGGSVACVVPESWAGNYLALFDRWHLFGAQHSLASRHGLQSLRPAVAFWTD